MILDLHALLKNNFEHKVFRRREPGRDVLSDTGCSGVGENRGEMFLVTQDAAHKGFFC